MKSIRIRTSDYRRTPGRWSLRENWSAFARAGWMRGAYHFFWPLTAWKAQADNFITTVGPLQPGDLPPVLDLEDAIPKGSPLKHDAWNEVPANQRLSIVQSWLDTVERGVGMRPIIYTRQNFIEPLLEWSGRTEFLRSLDSA